VGYLGVGLYRCGLPDAEHQAALAQGLPSEVAFASGLNSSP